MSRERYMNKLHARMHRWSRGLEKLSRQAAADPRAEDRRRAADEKYRQLAYLMTQFERLGAGAWREEQEALDRAREAVEAAVKSRTH